MKMKASFIIVAGFTTLLCACQGTSEAPKKDHKPSQHETPADNSKDVAEQTNDTKKTTANDQVDMVKLSEAFGNFIGRNLQMPGIKFDLEGIVKGIREGSEGKPSPLTEKEYEAMMAAVQEKAFKEMASKNMEEANDFLSKNSKATAVIEMEPGKLQYMIIQEGKGDAVVEHGSPMINYTGKYLDGTTFGSSEETGGPINVPLDQTIPGFSKAVAGMKEGEKRKIFVHPDLGYGATGQLPPNKLLIFEVEVVKANPAPDTKAADSKKVSDNVNFDDEADEDLDNESVDQEESK